MYVLALKVFEFHDLEGKNAGRMEKEKRGTVSHVYKWIMLNSHLTKQISKIMLKQRGQNKAT